MAMKQARVAVYQVTPGKVEAVVAKAKTGMLPIFQRHRGFIAYEIIRGGEDQAIPVSTWASRRDAEEAVGSAADFVQEQMADLVTLVQNYVGDVSFSSRNE